MELLAMKNLPAPTTKGKAALLKFTVRAICPPSCCQILHKGKKAAWETTDLIFIGQASEITDHSRLYDKDGLKSVPPQANPNSSVSWKCF